MQNESLNRLDVQLSEIARLAGRPETELLTVHPKVSAWSVAQHLDHSLKVGSAVLGVILTPKDPPKAGINLAGRVVLVIGRFPRGRGESPKPLRGEAADTPKLLAAVEKARALRARVTAETLLSPSPVLKHPYFGGLSAAQAVKFLSIHTKHHLAIVADILRAP